MRDRMSGVSTKPLLVMPNGSKIRSCITWPSRWPVTASTTWPAQSMLLPYSHRSPGSNSRGVLSDALLAVRTLGCPCSVAKRR